MSWLFLTLACTGALLTCNAFFPRKSPPGWAFVTSFVAGWLTTELALHLIALHAAIALAFVQLGALGDTAGQIALALSALSALGLLACTLQARGANLAIEQALASALAPAAEPTPDLIETFAAPLSPLRLLFPFLFADSRVERIDDVAYADAAGARNLLDIYRPRRKVAGAPVLLQIHGGGWVVGNKRGQARPLLYDLASRGFVCVSINYRLSPRATFPQHLIDAKRALIWTRRHIAEYGGDPNCILVTGGSAGGHLAALVALTANDPEYQPGDEGADTTVQACIPFYGIYDLAGLSGEPPPRGLVWLWQRSVLKRTLKQAREAFERASPFHHVRPDAPPFLIIHGTHDSLAPTSVARSFAAELKRVSRAAVVYVELPGAQHAFDIFHSTRTHHVIRGIHRFLAHVLAARASAAQSDQRAASDPARALDSVRP